MQASSRKCYQTYKAARKIFSSQFSLNFLYTYFKKGAIKNVSLKIKLPVCAERNIGFLTKSSSLRNAFSLSCIYKYSQSQSCICICVFKSITRYHLPYNCKKPCRSPTNPSYQHLISMDADHKYKELMKCPNKKRLALTLNQTASYLFL